MNDWPIRKLSDIVEFQNRKRIPLKSADRALRQGAYPYYGASGIVDWIDGYIFEGKHLLISEDGENLRSRTTPIAFRVGGRFWVNNHAHIVTEREPGILDYLEYAMARFDLAPYITGAVQPKLNKRTLESIELHVPPVTERLAINSLLNSLTDKIEMNRRMNATLEEMARALFRSWFVDFEPVHAKARGEAPAHMDAATAALFPDSFGEDELPKGWQRMPLRDAAVILSGGTPSKQNGAFWDGDLPWISPKVMTGVHVFDSEDRVTQAAVGKGTRLAPRGSTLVMVRGMGLHQGVRISQARREVTFNQDVKALVPTAVPASLLLFGLLDAAQFLFSKVESSGHGTGKLPSDKLEEVALNVPGASELVGLMSILDPINDRTAACEVETVQLADLRDALLPKLMSGELRVRDAEQQIAEAV